MKHLAILCVVTSGCLALSPSDSGDNIQPVWAGDEIAPLRDGCDCTTDAVDYDCAVYYIPAYPYFVVHSNSSSSDWSRDSGVIYNDETGGSLALEAYIGFGVYDVDVDGRDLRGVKFYWEQDDETYGGNYGAINPYTVWDGTFGNTGSCNPTTSGDGYHRCVATLTDVESNRSVYVLYVTVPEDKDGEAAPRFYGARICLD